jgi:hypothetical protein
MKKPQRLLILTATIILSLILTPVYSVFGESPDYRTTITYQNIGLEIAHITILYYPEGQSTPISIPRPDLPVGASASVSIGNINTSTSGQKGSAVIKSDVEVAVLVTQIPTTVNVEARPMAGVSTNGTPSLWLLYVVKYPGISQIISVQNVDNTPADLKFSFYGGGNPVSINKTNIPAGGAVYLDVSEQENLGSQFIGAVFVESVRQGGTTPGKITGMSLKSYGTNTEGSATESQTSVGSKIYMPIASCYGLGGMNSSYYIFNTDPAQSAAVTVTYNTGKFEKQTLLSRTGQFFSACNPSGTAKGYTGYAVITSTNSNLMALGILKLKGMSGTYIGQTIGTDRLAFPYASYSNSQYTNGQRSRTTISVMNLGGALKAGTVKAKYFGKDGTLIGTYSFPAFPSGAKIDTYAAQIGAAGAEFGYYADGSTGGSVIIEGPAGSSLMAIAWVMNVVSSGVYSGELYNGIQPIGTP